MAGIDALTEQSDFFESFGETGMDSGVDHAVRELTVETLESNDQSIILSLYDALPRVSPFPGLWAYADG